MLEKKWGYYFAISYFVSAEIAKAGLRLLSDIMDYK